MSKNYSELPNGGNRCATAWRILNNLASEIDPNLAGKYIQASIERTQTTEKCGPAKMFVAF
jgi:hypothetical protein